MIRQKENPAVLSTKSSFTAAKKSGGKPAFPTSRLLDLRDCFNLEGLAGNSDYLNVDQLGVGKVGLPPLFGEPNTLSVQRCLETWRL
jgi:hypothetical protein